ncbi:MAG: ParB/RepB/Spo0J family partition protein [Lentisphaeraceae bacterium]|nr:ParB/RepB/Spo0J family partition protein [Lentisphaeraceae bacterium]
MSKKLDMPDLSSLKNTMASITMPSTPAAQALPLDTVTASSQVVYDIPIKLINDNPKNGRRKYKADEIERLAASIEDTGFRGIIEVIKSPEKEGEYQLIYGHKRKRAALQANKVVMPCIIIEEEALATRKTSFYENFVRSDISKVEQAIELQSIKDDFDDITNVTLAKMTGMSEADISRFFKILQLPLQVQAVIDEGKLSFGHVKYLIPLLAKSEDDVFLTEAALKSVKFEWSIKELNRFLKNKEQAAAEVSRAGELDTNPKIEEMETDLKTKLKSSVSIKPSKNKGGKIVLNYGSNEELERIFDLLNNIN